MAANLMTSMETDGSARSNSAVPFLSREGLERARQAPCGGRFPRAIIDLRAPVEFDDDHMEGAINVPLFENETRSFVGMLYKQVSPEAAFQEARQRVIERIEGIVRDLAQAVSWDLPEDDLKARVERMTTGGIAQLEAELVPHPIDDLPEGAVVFSCARGGLRSRSVVALMRAIGFEGAVGLLDGYRSHRRFVMETLDAWEAPRHVFALRGLTGTGKTLLLRAIEDLRPGWTLDLEGAAGHRSSLLGMVGLEPTTQKAFESALAARATRGFADGVCIIEGESRKVGDVVVPKAMWHALQGAVNIQVSAPVPRRVAVLAEDYLAESRSRPKLRAQLEAVSSRMEGAPDLAGMLDRDEIGPLVELLLERYYDPLYLRGEEGKVYEKRVENLDEREAARQVVQWIESRLASH